VRHATSSAILPDANFGHEFVYSTQEESELAQDSRQTVLANEQPVPNSGATGLGR